MEKIKTDYERQLENFRLNFSRYAIRDGTSRRDSEATVLDNWINLTHVTERGWLILVQQWNSSGKRGTNNLRSLTWCCSRKVFIVSSFLAMACFTLINKTNKQIINLLTKRTNQPTNKQTNKNKTNEQTSTMLSCLTIVMQFRDCKSLRTYFLALKWRRLPRFSRQNSIGSRARWSHASEFSRWRWFIRVFASSFQRFIVLLTFAVIVHSNCFGSGFTKLNWKPL